jgi:hypothetical protein
MRALSTVIARSVSDEAIHSRDMKEDGLLRRFAPLRKRFAFVAGNDASPLSRGMTAVGTITLRATINGSAHVQRPAF